VTPVTLSPSPTASSAIGTNEVLAAGKVSRSKKGRVYSGAIAFSIGAPDNTHGNFLVEDAINYEAGLVALRRGGAVEEVDFPVGGPFGV
jgi:hypothetical protein